MIRKVIVFLCWLVVSMFLLPRIIPFDLIVSFDDFLTSNGIRIWGSHEFGDERIYDLAGDVFIIGSFVAAFAFTYLTLKFIRK